ncbi:hypothetical protein MA16_Dca006366 [Dendrobium catenatum]|uniref:Uncharacterized protein n=1 Tax=Dendrobium catenatum TaxID=906689 RepID=A0A2I0X7N8_9ASPA|nr:hypothetical protein MA16_Dca006366 [Dendrobium catenatum]
MTETHQGPPSPIQGRRRTTDCRRSVKIARSAHSVRSAHSARSNVKCFSRFDVLDESKDIETKSVAINERSKSDKMVDVMDFGDLCNDFECISSPYVEAIARQLARDILELREGNCSLGSYSISVKYKVNQNARCSHAADKKHSRIRAKVVRNEVEPKDKSGGRATIS